MHPHRLARATSPAHTASPAVTLTASPARVARHPHRHQLSPATTATPVLPAATVTSAPLAAHIATPAARQTYQPTDHQPRNPARDSITTLGDLVAMRGARHLEHLHAYTPPNASSMGSRHALAMHTDAGLFIAATAPSYMRSTSGEPGAEPEEGAWSGPLFERPSSSSEDPHTRR